MKAVVMETKNGSSVLLREDGTFEKVNRVYEIGQTIEWDPSVNVSDRQKYRTFRRYAGAAACLAVILAGGLDTTYQTALACSYVSLDVNPSIEFTLNRMNRVLSVSGLNDDAQVIVDELKEAGVRFDTLETALDKTQTILQEQNYLTESEPILIDISSDDPKRISELKEKVERSITIDTTADSLYLTTSSIKERNEAHDNNLSTGRYGAMKRNMQQTDQEITPESIEDFRTVPIDQLINSPAFPAAEKPQPQGQMPEQLQEQPLEQRPEQLQEQPQGQMPEQLQEQPLEQRPEQLQDFPSVP